MTRIMFVCHGNICRSPMAEFVLKKMLSERGMAHQWIVASSATSTRFTSRSGSGRHAAPSLSHAARSVAGILSSRQRYSISCVIAYSFVKGGCHTKPCNNPPRISSIIVGTKTR